MNEQEHQLTPEGHEDLRTEVPRIYVASLSDYNAGRLHGVWIDLDEDAEAMWSQVHGMLADSPEPGAEEWAIHDFENFGPLRLGEWEDLDRVQAIASGIVEHGEAFAAWAEELDRSEWADELPKFDEHFHGTWESMEAFAEQLLDDLGIDVDAIGPENLQAYVTFDLESFARDLAMDYRITEGKEGVHVFDY
jgi:antirestriction protein